MPSLSESANGMKENRLSFKKEPNASLYNHFNHISDNRPVASIKSTCDDDLFYHDQDEDSGLGCIASSSSSSTSSTLSTSSLLSTSSQASLDKQTKQPTDATSNATRNHSTSGNNNPNGSRRIDQLALNLASRNANIQQHKHLKGSIN